MKIVITAEGQKLTSRVDPRFGRAKWFVFYDTETEDFEAHPNEQGLDLPQGAGIQAAQQVGDHGAKVVLTGHCGPNAFRTLAAAGIDVAVGAEGTVLQAIGKFLSGDLEPTRAPDVDGHW